MFLQWILLCMSPGWANTWRFARNEMYTRPGSPTLTHARNTDQVCLYAGPVFTEQAGLWASQALAWAVSSLLCGSGPRSNPT